VLTLQILLNLTGCKSDSSDSTQKNTPMTVDSANIYFQNDGFEFPYNLSNPAKTYELTPELQEISGLTWFGEGTLACVQDESGRVYVFDLKTGKVTEKMDFDGPGDFEGLVRVEEKIWVARSDGNLFEFTPGEKARKYDTPLKKSSNLEGLAWQGSKNRLLLACKGAAPDPGTAGSPDLKGKQVIYGFDLETKEMGPNPAYIIDPETLPTAKGKSKKTKFKPSGIAVHPQTGDVYVIAHKGKMLIVLSESGELQFVHRLDSRKLPQPEGICFAPDGRLFLASEGDGGAGLILLFENGN
jgi:uncharacterized protein YjiK